jgi:phosphoribosylaminoimidazolecarboxamide formyltransferase/IMP cyclohydrolase
MAMNKVEKIDNRVHVDHVLISVSDKSGLEAFVPRLLRINPDVRIFSTGGTYARLREILGDRADGCLTQVSDYTGQPETQGGWLKPWILKFTWDFSPRLTTIPTSPI